MLDPPKGLRLGCWRRAGTCLADPAALRRVAPGGTLEAPRGCTAGGGAETRPGGPGTQLCEAWTQIPSGND